ncbi:MAG: hypothetical protein H0X28_09355 [Solirubrobacterales bacterium]|nr:hypothetical protein [Solirubrobacterales bacterium]
MFKTVLVVLVAVLAVSALVSASASAATCTTKPCFTGPYPNTFITTSGAFTRETSGGTRVKCSGPGSTEGAEITAEKYLKVKALVFKGCETGGFKCNTAGAKQGEIKTNELEGILGYVSKATKTVGVDLKPKGGGNVAKFECTAFITVIIRGSIIGAITPINIETTKYRLVFNEAKGKQQLQNLEGQAKDTLESSTNGGSFEGEGWELSEELTLAKTVKIEA